MLYETHRRRAQESDGPSLLEDALRIAASLVMAFAVVVVISLHHENAEADYEAAGLESGSRE
jgi:hypothetical protein